MEIIGRFFLSIADGMKHEMVFYIFGFSFSLWDVFVFCALAEIVFWAIGKIFE